MSNFISPVDLGSYDYFVFTENDGLWRSMNGLAAWFNGSTDFLSNAALLGGLVLLAMALFGFATHQRKLSAGIIGVWLFFAMMVGFKATANIYNVYTGQVTVVDNVPAIALLPASVFSKAGYKVFTTTETSFQGVNGSYMSVTKNGFASPLEILLTLRSSRVPGKTPGLSRSLAQVVHDCGTDPNLIASAPPLSESLDVLAWFKEYGRKSGPTTVFLTDNPADQGEINSCGDAFDYLNIQYSNLALGGTRLMETINFEVSRPNPQRPDGKWEASAIQDTFTMLIEPAITGANASGRQTVQEFTKNALVATTVNYTLDCQVDAGAMTRSDTCAVGAVALADGMENWKTRAAMNGSGFLKTMFTSMSFMQALFFALFPVVAIVALVNPTMTPQIVFGYVLFGIWAQSWLLVVAPVQLFVQNEVINEMTRQFGNSGGLSLANAGAIYDALSTKLAVASDVMASSQMLAIGLLTGSLGMAASRASASTNGSAGMDTSMVQQRAGNQRTLTQTADEDTKTNIYRSPSGQFVGQTSGVAGGGQYSLASNYIQNASKSRGSDQTYSADVSRSQDQAFAKTLSEKTGMSQEKALAISHGLSASEGYNASVGTNVLKALTGAAVGALGKSGVKLSPDKLAEVEKQAAAAQGKAIEQLSAKDAGFIDRLMGKAGADAKAEAVGQVIDVGSDVLSVGLATAGMFTGVGAPVGVAAGAGVKLAAQGAKRSVMSKIKEGAVDAAAAAAQVAAVRNAPGGIESFAKGVAGGISAQLTANVLDQMNRQETDSSKVSRSSDKSFSASDADKLSKAWRSSRSESISESASGSQTQTSSITLSPEQVARIGMTGYGGLSADMLHAGAAANAAKLQSMHSKDAVARAWGEVNRATLGRSGDTFGGGSKGQAVANFERNILFEHFLTGQVSGSLNGGALDGLAPAAGKPYDAPIKQKVSTGGLGQGVGNTPGFANAAGGFLAKGGAASDRGFAGAAPALGENVTSAFDQAKEDATDKIKGVAIASGVAQGAGALAEIHRLRNTPVAGGAATPGDSQGKPKAQEQPVEPPKQREPVNQRTRLKKR